LLAEKSNLCYYGFLVKYLSPVPISALERQPGQENLENSDHAEKAFSAS